MLYTDYISYNHQQEAKSVTTSIYFDFGRVNARAVFTPHNKMLFPSQIAELTAAQYEKIMDSPNDELKHNVFFVSADFGKGIEEKCYIIGKGADRYPLLGGAQSAKRYVTEIIGVMTATTAVRLLQRSIPDLVAWLTYPPVDRRYKSALVNAVKGQYSIEWCGHVYDVNITDVRHENEPIAAMYNSIFKQNGEIYNHSLLQDGLTIAFDGGGRTFDYSVVEIAGQRYEVQPDMLNSDDEIALNDTLSGFIDEVKTYHSELFIGSSRSFTSAMWRKAFMTGEIMLAGNVYDVRELRDQHRQVYLNAVQRLIDSIGGLVAYSNVLIAGGWALLFADLNMSEVLNHGNVDYALGHGQYLFDGNNNQNLVMRDDILYAQSLGLYKFAQALEVYS